MCANTQTGVTHQPAITFWSYLLVRVLLGVLTAASLMMFEGAVMATIQGRARADATIQFCLDTRVLRLMRLRWGQTHLKILDTLSFPPYRIELDLIQKIRTLYSRELEKLLSNRKFGYL